MNLTLISSQPWIIHRWIILTPSSQLTSEIWRGCEYYNLKWPSRTILLNDSLEWSSCRVIGCWWFGRRFFKYHRCIFSQRNHAVPRLILLSKTVSLRAVLHENDLELFLCNIPIRIPHLLKELLKSWQVFHHWTRKKKHWRLNLFQFLSTKYKW